MIPASPLVSIVDDDVSVRRAVRRMVRSGGYAVQSFPSAREFIDALALGRPACVVLDIHLDGMSGLELERRLAADGAGIPIVFITGHDDEVTRGRVRQSGALAYLRKPFDKRALLDAIGKALHPPS
jgi:FixJ family two-component response regulator